MQFNPSDLPPANASNYYYSLGAFIDDEPQAAPANKAADNDFDYWAPNSEIVTLNAIQDLIFSRACAV